MRARRRPEWMAQGACAGHPESLWFGPHTVKAREVCRSCPVIVTCGQYAMDERLDHGVWGGMTAPERVRLRDAS